jgi:hypothetical protein
VLPSVSGRSDNDRTPLIKTALSSFNSKISAVLCVSKNSRFKVERVFATLGERFYNPQFGNLIALPRHRWTTPKRKWSERADVFLRVLLLLADVFATRLRR